MTISAGSSNKQANNDSRLQHRVRNIAAPPGESWSIIRYIADCNPVSVFGALYKNMTSSTKPEVHKEEPSHGHTSHVQQNYVKFGHVVFETCEHKDRQTDRHRDTLIAILCTPTRGKKTPLIF